MFVQNNVTYVQENISFVQDTGHVCTRLCEHENIWYKIVIILYKCESFLSEHESSWRISEL